MAPFYLDLQISEAIKRAKGNQTKAKAALLAMAAEDQRLLFTLAKPYLGAIAAQAITRFANTQQKNKKSLEKELPAMPKSAGKGQAGFGLDLLKALGGHNVAKFGQEDAAPPMRKKAASAQHVDALKLMASKSKTKPNK